VPAFTWGGGNFLGPLVDTRSLAAQGGWQPLLSLGSSLAAGVLLLALAVYDFPTADY
jgi:hypothetical protein